MRPERDATAVSCLALPEMSRPIPRTVTAASSRVMISEVAAIRFDPIRSDQLCLSVSLRLKRRRHRLTFWTYIKPAASVSAADFRQCVL